MEWIISHWEFLLMIGAPLFFVPLTWYFFVVLPAKKEGLSLWEYIKKYPASGHRRNPDSDWLISRHTWLTAWRWIGSDISLGRYVLSFNPFNCRGCGGGIDIGHHCVPSVQGARLTRCTFGPHPHQPSFAQKFSKPKSIFDELSAWSWEAPPPVGIHRLEFMAN